MTFQRIGMLFAIVRNSALFKIDSNVCNEISIYFEGREINTRSWQWRHTVTMWFCFCLLTAVIIWNWFGFCNILVGILCWLGRRFWPERLPFPPHQLVFAPVFVTRRTPSCISGVFRFISLHSFSLLLFFIFLLFIIVYLLLCLRDPTVGRFSAGRTSPLRHSPFPSLTFTLSVSRPFCWVSALEKNSTMVV